jgi:hypothetical protein
MADLTEYEKEVNARFIEVYRYLKEEGRVKNKSEFAKLLDMPKEYMSHAEQNKRAIPSHFIIRLYKNLDISDKWLSSGEGQMFKHPSSAALMYGNRAKASGNTLNFGSHLGTAPGSPDLAIENERLKQEVEHLKQRLKDKEEFIEFLKSQNAK